MGLFLGTFWGSFNLSKQIHFTLLWRPWLNQGLCCGFFKIFDPKLKFFFFFLKKSCKRTLYNTKNLKIDWLLIQFLDFWLLYMEFRKFLRSYCFTKMIWLSVSGGFFRFLTWNFSLKNPNFFLKKKKFFSKIYQISTEDEYINIDMKKKIKNFFGKKWHFYKKIFLKN